MDTHGRFVATMMGLHGLLEEQFFAHQQALLDRDFVRAAACLADYRDRLFRHMQDEEDLVLPRYEAAGGNKTDAPLKLFLGEHTKMREFVADFGVRLRGLAQRADDRGLLELFDREATYKNLVLHHDLRERNHLYPFMAKRLPEAEQEEMLAALRWQGG